MQKLSKRLQAAADYVAYGSCVADIGTDHGYLPIYLVQSGRCPRALAMDIREGPLQRAREHIELCGLLPYIQTRLSDGLQSLGPGEADSVVIAGMGGLTIIKILDAAYNILADIKELILEPQSDLAAVRKFLREHSMYVDRENLVLEDGKYYPILHVAAHKPRPLAEHALQMRQSLLEQLPEQGRLQQVLDQYGEQLIYNRHPVLKLLLERDERQTQRILDSLSEIKQEKHAARRAELTGRLAEIRVLRNVI